DNRDRAVPLETAGGVPELLALERQSVVQPHFLDRPPRVDQELIDIPGDEPGAHDPQRMGPRRSPVQPVCGENGRSGRPGGRDDRTLEDGEWVPGVMAIEHEDRRGPRKASLNVAGKTGDPLEPRHVEAV